jgi:peptidylprolyl isomerase
VGSEKRERQKLSRQAKIEAEESAARRTKTRRTGIRVAVAAVVVIGAMFAYSAISGGDDSDDSPSEESAAPETPETTAAPGECETPAPATPYSNPGLAEEVLARDAPDPEPPPEDTDADALEETTLIEGEGDAAVAGDTLIVAYSGKIADGTVFDESWSTCRTFDVTLGSGGVIPGWDEGLVGAKIGERRHLVIGSEKGYGAAGSGPIPPDAPLAFDVDVVDIVPAG